MAERLTQLASSKMPFSWTPAANKLFVPSSSTSPRPQSWSTQTRPASFSSRSWRSGGTGWRDRCSPLLYGQKNSISWNTSTRLNSSIHARPAKLCFFDRFNFTITYRRKDHSFCLLSLQRNAFSFCVSYVFFFFSFASSFALPSTRCFYLGASIPLSASFLCLP